MKMNGSKEMQSVDGKRLFFWNMIGSGIYAVSSFALVFLTIRLAGETEGGIFSIGITIAQMMVYIVYYETRNYCVTDPDDTYSFADYHTLKIVNGGVMFALSVLYVLLCKYHIQKMVVVLLLCVFRFLDGYADVYEGEFHRRGRLDLAGMSMTFRTVLSTVVYFLALILTKKLIVSLLFSLFGGVIGIVLFDVVVLKKQFVIDRWIERAKLKALELDCFPMFIGMFMWTYILSAPRLMVDRFMNDASQARFQLMFLPVSVVNLFAGFVIRPSLIKLTEDYSQKNIKSFVRSAGRIAAVILFATLCAILLAYYLGAPALRIVSGVDLSSCEPLLAFLMFAGGVNAVSVLLYYLLTVTRNKRAIIVGYVSGSVVVTVVCGLLTRPYGFWGASIGYLGSSITLIIVFGFFLINDLKNIG